MLRFASLHTPSEDGATLVEPAPETLAEQVARNHRALARVDAPVHGRPVHELRTSLRSALADANGDRPVIVTGHQPELYHAGVWAKNIVAARLAEAVEGKAVNLIVDNDAPKKGTLTVPHCGGAYLSTQEVPFFEYRVGLAFEQYDPLDERAGRRLLEELRRALGDDAYEQSSLPRMARALTDRTRAQDLVDQVTHARKAIEQDYGLHLTERRVSQCWSGPMLLDIVLNAPRFAECYNASLADYREALGLKSAQRPVPDLTEVDGRIELPVWVYRHGQPRRRLFVQREDDHIRFFADDTEMGVVRSRDLEREDAMSRVSAVLGWRFRPRALTLTLWARLLLADVFIHGIGGAKYDRITDRLMERYFGVEPPTMACVSATLLLPLDRFPVDKDSLLEARRKVRDIRFNPQRYVSAVRDGLSDLLQKRTDAIAESNRLAREEPDNHDARRETWLAIRRVNAELLAVDPSLPRRMAEHEERIRRQLAHNQVADSREYFFGLLPRAKLNVLLDALPNASDLRRC